MSSVDFDTAVADFLALGRRLTTSQPLTGQRVLDELTTWYRNCRITETALDEDQDMLLLQWGSTRPILVNQPTDLRKRSGDELTFADRNLKYLDFTRQVFAPGAFPPSPDFDDDFHDYDDDEGNVGFDDVAVQMSITLGFSPADGSEPNSNLWIDTPNEIGSGKDTFLRVPFVQSLITLPAQILSIKIDNCG